MPASLQALAVLASVALLVASGVIAIRRNSRGAYSASTSRRSPSRSPAPVQRTQVVTDWEDELLVRRRGLMTKYEQEFIALLEAALPEYRIHSQVCMGALMEPDVPRSQAFEHNRIRWRFAQKMVDFVLEEKQSGRVIALVELDDPSHDEDRDRERDALTQTAGYVTLRWHVAALPSTDEIRSVVNDARFGRLAAYTSRPT